MEEPQESEFPIRVFNGHSNVVDGSAASRTATSIISNSGRFAPIAPTLTAAIQTRSPLPASSRNQAVHHLISLSGRHIHIIHSRLHLLQLKRGMLPDTSLSEAGGPIDADRGRAAGSDGGMTLERPHHSHSSRLQSSKCPGVTPQRVVRRPLKLLWCRSPVRGTENEPQPNFSSPVGETTGARSFRSEVTVLDECHTRPKSGR
jgi:hypothetical protein